jgi:hypothetical protein
VYPRTRSGHVSPHLPAENQERLSLQYIYEGTGLISTLAGPAAVSSLAVSIQLSASPPKKRMDENFQYNGLRLATQYNDVGQVLQRRI